MNDFISSLRCGNYSPHTISAYHHDIKGLLSYLEDTLLSARNLKDYFATLQKDGFKCSSLIRKRIAIRRFVKFMINKKRIRQSVLKGLEISLRKEEYVPRVVTIKELKMILKRLDSNVAEKKTGSYACRKAIRDRAMIDLMITTGMRVGEIITLKCQDLNLNDRSFIIHGKGNKERWMYISSGECLQHLKDWLSLRHDDNDGHVFLNRRGTGLSRHSIENVFKNLCMSLTLNKQYTCHSLRHAFATNLIAANADLKTVQELLGHSSITTTALYTHIDMNRKINVLKKCNCRNKI